MGDVYIISHPIGPLACGADICTVAPQKYGKKLEWQGDDRENFQSRELLGDYAAEYSLTILDIILYILSRK